MAPHASVVAAVVADVAVRAVTAARPAANKMERVYIGLGSNLAEPMTHDEPFIVPLAVPYIAGPSLLAVIVVGAILIGYAFYH